MLYPDPPLRTRPQLSSASLLGGNELPETAPLLSRAAIVSSVKVVGLGLRLGEAEAWAAPLQKWAERAGSIDV